MQQEREFKLNDRVFDIRFCWGEIIEINTDLKYPLKVEFSGKRYEKYTRDGRWQSDESISLSHNEYSLNPPNFPKVLEVSKDGEHWKKRVVVEIKNDVAMCFPDATSLQEIEHLMIYYPCYREIDEMVELTIEDVSAKFNVPREILEQLIKNFYCIEE